MKDVFECSYRPIHSDERIKIAFLLQVASFWPSWESFYLSCVNDVRFEARLYLVQDGVDTSNQFSSARSFMESSGLSFYDFSDSEFETFAPHIAVLQTPYDYLHRKPHLYSISLKKMGIRVVFIPYGIELADTEIARHAHFREPVLRNAWRIYTLSDGFKREYEKYCENAMAVRALGLPRFDSLMQRDRFLISQELRRRINGRKIIVWHTHFAKTVNIGGELRQSTPYLEEYIAFAENIARYNDELFFIFLPHPCFGDDALDDINNKKSAKLLEIISSADNIFIDRADDYRNTLLNADAIITDRSALMIESAVVGVPVLYLKNHDYSEATFPPLLPIADSYYQGTGSDDMVKFLDDFQNGSDEKKLVRESALRKCVPHLDGKCGERIKEDIILSVKSCAPQENKKLRVVLFGTGFLYRQVMSVFVFPKNCEVVVLSDNDNSKWNQIYDGVIVVPPEEINQYEFDKIIIMAGNVFEEQIYQQLRFDLEIPDSKIEYCEYLATL